MSEYVIVRINDKLIPEFQINYDPKTTAITKRLLKKWSEIEVTEQQKLLVILPSNHILNAAVNIPSKNEEVIRQSLPYTVEEQLANDVEDNHYAYRQAATQQFVVSVIKKRIMDEIVHQLEKNQLKCDHVFSELYTIPVIDGFTSFIINNHGVIVRDGEKGTSLKRQLLAQYLKRSGNKMHVAYCEHEIKLANNSSITLNKQDTVKLQAKTLVEQLLAGTTVNLLQGPYKDNQEQKTQTTPIKRLAILASILMVSWLSINGYRLWSLNDDINTLKTDQLALFVELVPNANDTERNDPYSALLSRLKISASQNSQSSSVGFITALSYLGQTLAIHPNIEVQSLRQRKTTLEVNIQAPNVTALNQFQSSLEKNVLAMRVKTGTRNTNKDGIRSIITMEQL